jgi:hypothetical protein
MLNLFSKLGYVQMMKGTSILYWISSALARVSVLVSGGETLALRRTGGYGSEKRWSKCICRPHYSIGQRKQSLKFSRSTVSYME